MEYIPYRNESKFDSKDIPQNIKVKLGHAALFEKNDVL